MRAAAILAALAAACAPQIDGPADHQRSLDRDDSAALAAQLASLPGALHADVILHRAVVDPFTRERTSATASIFVAVDNHADRAAIANDARQLIHGVAPDLAPSIVVAVTAPRPELASIGPFTVEAASKHALVAALAAAFAVVAALAGWIAWRERPSGAPR